MRKIYFFIQAALLSFILHAQQQRALIIGIDKYSPPPGAKISTQSGRIDWVDLDGCKNDAIVIKEMINSRYGFKNENIKELHDGQATRNAILSAINDLLARSVKGDIAFIYYAGHGSQEKNSKSIEDDKLDESMVPVDAWKEGVEDIRDKTLAALINKFIDKGVVLTCIYDCCHSGSIGRGLQNEPPKFRFIRGSNHDAMDASNPIVPETRKDSRYLIISAAQDTEFAQEQRDDNDIPHGAFTLAFLQALNQQSVDASVSNLFNAARAILKNNGKNQEPVMAGAIDRQQGTLFGYARGSLPNKILIPVIRVNPKNVVFQGGFISGLNVENELKKFNGNIKVKITKLVGANRSEGEIIEGKATDIKPGELFEVTNWVSSAAPYLKIYIPDNSISYEQVQNFAGVAREIMKIKQDSWVSDLEKTDPDITIYNSKNKWWANDPLKGAIEIKDFSVPVISEIGNRQKIYINIPPPKSLADYLKKSFADLRNVSIVNHAADAQYSLTGTINDKNNLAYGFVRSQTSAKDSLEMMPLQTRTFELKSDTDPAYRFVSDSLFEYSVRLSKIRAWSNMKSPNSNDEFPFYLELRNNNSKKPIDSIGARVGDVLTLYLTTDKNYAEKWNDKQRYIYIFLIDKNGNMTLMYPDENVGNVGNKHPKIGSNNRPLPEKKLMEVDVTEPVGTDTYYLLATEDPIQNYQMVFNQEGVRGTESELGELLNIGNATTRSRPRVISNNWYLQKVSLKTRH